MTLIIAECFEKAVVVVSDMRRVAVDEKGVTGYATKENSQKIHVIAPRVGIATSGLGSASDAAVMGIKASFQGKAHVKISQVVLCAQACFSFNYERFKIANPDYHDVGMSYVIFGIGEDGQPFVYGCESSNGFQVLEIKDRVALGSGCIEARNVMGETEIKNLDEATGVFVNAVRETSKSVSSVGDVAHMMLINDNSVQDFIIDSEGIL